MSLEPIIKAKSEEEHRYLKESYKKFEEYYELEFSYGGPEVLSLCGDSITIHPCEKEGNIKKIHNREQNLGGILLDSSPNNCFIKLKDKIYDIRYNHR